MIMFQAADIEYNLEQIVTQCLLKSTDIEEIGGLFQEFTCKYCKLYAWPNLHSQSLVFFFFF